MINKFQSVHTVSQQNLCTYLKIDEFLKNKTMVVKKEICIPNVCITSEVLLLALWCVGGWFCHGITTIPHSGW